MSATQDLVPLADAVIGASCGVETFLEQLHRAFGVTPGVRALLLHLADNGPRTLSEIAVSRRVSRQFVQKAARPLLGKGLLAADPNPRHRGAPKLRLTPWGVRVVEQIRAREALAFARVANELDSTEIGGALAVIRAFDAGVCGETAIQAQPSST